MCRRMILCVSSTGNISVNLAVMILIITWFCYPVTDEMLYNWKALIRV